MFCTVVVDHYFRSVCSVVSARVPQASVLGPLLFLVFIIEIDIAYGNNAVKVTPLCSCLLVVLTFTQALISVHILFPFNKHQIIYMHALSNNNYILI